MKSEDGGTELTLRLDKCSVILVSFDSLMGSALCQVKLAGPSRAAPLPHTDCTIHLYNCGYAMVVEGPPRIVQRGGVGCRVEGGEEEFESRSRNPEISTSICPSPLRWRPSTLNAPPAPHPYRFNPEPGYLIPGSLVSCSEVPY